MKKFVKTFAVAASMTMASGYQLTGSSKECFRC